MAKLQLRARLFDRQNSFLIALLTITGINCALWMLLVLAGMIVTNRA